MEINEKLIDKIKLFVIVHNAKEILISNSGKIQKSMLLSGDGHWLYICFNKILGISAAEYNTIDKLWDFGSENIKKLKRLLKNET